jgi:hypothetical protein
VEPASKVYGDSDPVFTVNYDGFLYSDDETDLGGTLVFNRGAGEGVGEYTITASGLTSANYNLEYIDGTLEITTRELIIGGTFTVLDKVNDGTVDAVIDQNNLTLVGVVAGDDVALVNVVTEFTQVDAGNEISVVIVSAELDGPDKGNYTLSLVGAPVATGNITTNIGDIVVERIRVYPNPFIEYLYFNYLPESSKVTITDITGRRLVSMDTNGDEFINLNYLPKGVFILSIETPTGERSILRVVKQ